MNERFIPVLYYNRHFPDLMYDGVGFVHFVYREASCFLSVNKFVL